MKKSIYVLGIAIISLASCKTESTPVDYAVITGKINNASTTELIIASFNDRKAIDTVAIAADGTFTDTIVNAKGHYAIVNDKNRADIYLEEGFNIAFNADATDFNKSIVITGNGAVENNFFTAKKEKENSFRNGTNPYTLDEAAFKEEMLSQKNALNAIVDTTEGLTEEFKKEQKNDNNYNYLVSLSNFERYHQHYAKKPEFKVSENFLAELDAVDINNENDFSKSSAYKSLVATHYGKIAAKKAEKDSISYDLAMLKTVAPIKSETIRNSLLKDAIFGITVTDNLEEYYNTFISASTDEEQNKTVKDYYTKLKAVEKGNPSPKFIGYENHAGGKTSLEDLKGKYVYIDVWATWCGPCIAEIPALKETEKAYHNKNIEFVSISVDRPDAYNKWKQMVVDKELGGVQLIADNNFESDFIQDYVIQGIPKFILLDTEGNIVNANAPRPSDPKLKEVLNSLL
ncbi:TlpA family protein disulfide reductase [Cellulophaga omnivescoria]|uniref:TlpA family protein disulfide reductase n=1 Tax=Cellulophaga omnivescoria TaxID=1888890 RepID=UPI0022F1017C|nr:TlpA disulfide reductase family protein [Cellulophaga omnivescoria]WBU88771.1 TlpA disulfide reductase family protein [Cellulophaga omnivescoria]WKB80747.1 TlpA disulfide reductase family protein [Cellulophaga lytica]